MLIQEENKINHLDSLPLILSLTKGGEPTGWITWQESAFYAAKNKILWSMGETEIVLRGGKNRMTGEQSILKIDTIVAIDNDVSPSKYRKDIPLLTNRRLFQRDRRICAYCGELFSLKSLTRDHIIPRSKGGIDCWENVVTSCRSCNQRKDARTPEQASMPLIYVPYAPNFNETLILENHRILADQMQFLIKGVSKNSRIHEHYQ